MPFLIEFSVILLILNFFVIIRLGNLGLGRWLVLYLWRGMDRLIWKREGYWWDWSSEGLYFPRNIEPTWVNKGCRVLFSSNVCLLLEWLVLYLELLIIIIVVLRWVECLIPWLLLISLLLLLVLVRDIIILLIVMLFPLIWLIRLALVTLGILGDGNLNRFVLFCVVIIFFLILIIVWRMKILFMLRRSNYFFDLLELVQVLSILLVFIVFIIIFLLAYLVLSYEVIIILEVSPGLLSTLIIVILAFSLIVTVISVVSRIVVGELMFVAFAWVILTMIVIVTTKLIKTFRIELIAIGIEKTLIVRQDVET